MSVRADFVRWHAQAGMPAPPRGRLADYACEIADSAADRRREIEPGGREAQAAIDLMESAARDLLAFADREQSVRANPAPRARRSTPAARPATTAQPATSPAALTARAATVRDRYRSNR